MSRSRIVLLLVLGLLAFAVRELAPTGGSSAAQAPTGAVESPAKTVPTKAPPTRQTWGNPGSLPDHFARHGGDFGAKDADDYARMAWEFHELAKAGRLRVKVDEEGVWRVFDPRTSAFAAYNRDGTTKTFFKPGNPGYFDRQPGRLTAP